MVNAPKFCKIFIDDKDDFLRIPKEFKNRYSKDLPIDVYLKVPGLSLLWDVELVYSNVSVDDDELLMKKGWVEFRDHYSIVVGHYLVFQYNGASRFDVVIFDMMGSEIEYGVAGKNSVPFIPPRFHKILVDFKLDTLRIPVNFTGKYGAVLPNAVTFKVPRGESWRVELTHNKDGEIWLGKGWKEFKYSYSISFGQTLVFQYDTVSFEFEIWIFGKTDVEIDYLQQPDIESGSESESFGRVSCDRADVERQSGSDTSTYTTLEIKGHNGHRITLPKEFTQANMIEKGMELILQNVKGKRWHVRVISKGCRVALCSGWHNFLVENNVIAGTKMSFKMVSPSGKVIETQVVEEGPKPHELMEYFRKGNGTYKFDASLASRQSRSSKLKSAKKLVQT